MAAKTNITYISIFFVTILTICSWLAISLTQNMLAQKQQKKDDVDFFMHDVVYTQMAEDGSVQNQLRSPKIVHYLQDDTYTFSSPHLMLIDASKHPWEISADSGIGKKNGEEIHLWDNVNIMQKTTGTQQNAMQVLTSSATIYPKEKKAYTDKPLTITQAGTVVNAVGAEVDFRTSTIKLLSQVRGQYAPRNSKP